MDWSILVFEQKKRGKCSSAEVGCCRIILVEW